MEDDKKSKFCPTSASSRKMAAVHGSCGARPAPVSPFRSRLPLGRIHKVNTGFINENFEIDLRFKRMKLCIEGQLHAINCEKCEIIAIQAISTK
mgnify:CR=1 FL=1